jgi:hypothetical protein
LLCYLCDEVLVYCHPFRIVSRDFWYAYGLPTSFSSNVADTGTGIALVYYQATQPTCTIWRSSTITIGVPYSISVSLDILITLMIITRLVLLGREIQQAMNAPFKFSGMYTAIVTVLSESSALYGVTFLLFITTWAVDNPVEYYFFPILAEVQVRDSVVSPDILVLG